ncbi:casein kinase ii subunit beta [Anaeramoeba flamelloides]|uniref:Casein kinase II subunit beta n=1 Tax=Anaeramoeba flamelloides TaxID=1746091 RepID=A0AAV7ZXN5_9EUKA|nr:casein kinase ii subunit beta [Anaeramoeba flamelloides]KAJ6239764.1 casein kinase ii subunit beta [Anaeramoeba flamelloides]
MTQQTKNNSTKHTTWIKRFCSQKGKEFFCQVSKEYVNSNFNLFGLQKNSEHIKSVLKIIRDEKVPELELMTKKEKEQVYAQTVLIYGLIHARYILTDEGMRKMERKYLQGVFGKCPNIFCKRQPCLPLGRSDQPHKSAVKLYCPKCREIYLPKQKYRIFDGAFFGTTFAHMILNVRPTLQPTSPPRKYIPKIFGFEIYNSVPNNSINSDEDKKIK